MSTAYPLLLHGHDTIECAYYLAALPGSTLDFEKLAVEKEALRLAKVRHPKAITLDAVRGHEGAAARAHFAALRELLAPQWQFDGRSRRSPGDRVNALLSYGYGILYHTMLNLIVRRGLDPPGTR